MTDNQHKAPEIKVDEDWKSRARQEPDASAAGPIRLAALTTPLRPTSDSYDAAQLLAALPPFIRLVADLGLQASVHLGMVENPLDGEKKKNLPAARAVLDMLGAIEEKTANNLEPDEQAYLQDLLYSLRMGYVKEAK